MDKTVPAPAAILLDFIGQTEAPRGYNTIYGNKQHKLKVPVTSMTIDEVLAAMRGWSKNHGSSATGRYQFMRATLRGLVSELGLRGSQKFDADLQDRLGYHLLLRRGYVLYMAGSITLSEFAKRLAMEWASFPVLFPTQGAHQWIGAGQSYYAGDHVNKALVGTEIVKDVLIAVRMKRVDETLEEDLHVELEPASVQVVTPSKPAPVQTGFWAWLKGLFT